MNEDLLALYNNAFDETRHYRSFEWQITVWSTTLLAAISTVPKVLLKHVHHKFFFKSSAFTFRYNFRDFFNWDDN